MHTDFTYITPKQTKLFKHTNLKISHNTDNTFLIKQNVKILVIFAIKLNLQNRINTFYIG